MTRKVPYRYDDETVVQAKQKTLVWLLSGLISLTAGGTWSWYSVKTIAESAQKAAATAVAAQAIDHDDLVRSQEKIAGLVKTVEKIDTKLDRLLERSIPMNAPTIVTRAP